jgi:drug/metabolite transporter (DMT)-like permease
MSIIEALEPIIVSVMGVYFLHDRITSKEKEGIAIALLGTIVTIIGPAVSAKIFGHNYTVDSALGNLVIFLFICIDSYTYILVKELLRQKVGAFSISNLSFISGLAGIIPIMLYFEGGNYFIYTVTHLSLISHLGVWYMAIVSGTLAYALYNMGQKTIEVSEAAVFRYLMPVLTTPMAIILLAERISIHFVIGATLIMIGVVLVEFKRKKIKISKNI